METAKINCTLIEIDEVEHNTEILVIKQQTLPDSLEPLPPPVILISILQATIKLEVRKAREQGYKRLYTEYCYCIDAEIGAGAVAALSSFQTELYLRLML